MGILGFVILLAAVISAIAMLAWGFGSAGCPTPEERLARSKWSDL